MSLDGFNIRLLDGDVKISNNILRAMEGEMKTRLQKVKAKIHSGIINLVIEALSICPEIQSLRNGKLKADFGLDSDPTQDIIYAIANSVEVIFRDVKLTKTYSKAVLSVYIQPSDFSNLLGQDFARVVTEKGDTLPWLSWLITQGDSVIISEYSVQYGGFSSSRSGQAIMKPFGVFKVDSSFSGTVNNNFITRALEKYSDRISEEIGSHL